MANPTNPNDGDNGQGTKPTAREKEAREKDGGGEGTECVETVIGAVTTRPILEKITPMVVACLSPSCRGNQKEFAEGVKVLENAFTDQPPILAGNQLTLVLYVVFQLLKKAFEAYGYCYGFSETPKFAKAMFGDLSNKRPRILNNSGAGGNNRDLPPPQQNPAGNAGQVPINGQWAERDNAGNLFYVRTRYFVHAPTSENSKDEQVRVFSSLATKHNKQYPENNVTSYQLANKSFRESFGGPGFPNSALQLNQLMSNDDPDHNHPYYVLSWIDMLFYGQYRKFNSLPQFEDMFQHDACSKHQEMEKLLATYKTMRPDIRYEAVPMLYQEIMVGKPLDGTPARPYVVVGGFVCERGVKYFIYHPPTGRVIPSETGHCVRLGLGIRSRMQTSAVLPALLRFIWPGKAKNGNVRKNDESRYEFLPPYFVYREDIQPPHEWDAGPV